jgi:hypothetical protein
MSKAMKHFPVGCGRNIKENAEFAALILRGCLEKADQCSRIQRK